MATLLAPAVVNVLDEQGFVDYKHPAVALWFNMIYFEKNGFVEKHRISRWPNAQLVNEAGMILSESSALIQLDPNKQPIFRMNRLNHHPSMYFAPGTEMVTLTDDNRVKVFGTDRVKRAAFTMLLVVKTTAVNSIGPWPIFTVSGKNAEGNEIDGYKLQSCISENTFGSPSLRYRFECMDESIIGDSTESSLWRVVVIVKDATTCKIYPGGNLGKNAAEISLSTSGFDSNLTFAATRLTLAGGSDIFSQEMRNLDGEICEMVSFDGQLDDDSITAWGVFLADKYQLPFSWVHSQTGKRQLSQVSTTFGASLSMITEWQVGQIVEQLRIPSGKTLALTRFTDLAKHKNAQTFLIATRAYELMGEEITNKNGDVAALSAATAGLLVGRSSSPQEIMLTCRIVQQCVTVLSSTTVQSGLATALLSLLGSLASHPIGQRRIIEAGGVKVVASYLEHAAPMAAAHCCRVLGNFSSRGSHAQMVLDAAGPLLFKLPFHHDIFVVTESLKAIASIAEHPECHTTLSELDIIPMIINVLNTTNNHPVPISAASSSLASLCGTLNDEFRAIAASSAALIDIVLARIMQPLPRPLNKFDETYYSNEISNIRRGLAQAAACLCSLERETAGKYAQQHKLFASVVNMLLSSSELELKSSGLILIGVGAADAAFAKMMIDENWIRTLLVPHLSVYQVSNNNLHHLACAALSNVIWQACELGPATVESIAFDGNGTLLAALTNLLVNAPTLHAKMYACHCLQYLCTVPSISIKLVDMLLPELVKFASSQKQIAVFYPDDAASSKSRNYDPLRAYFFLSRTFFSYEIRGQPKKAMLQCSNAASRVIAMMSSEPKTHLAIFENNAVFACVDLCRSGWQRLQYEGTCSITYLAQNQVVPEMLLALALNGAVKILNELCQSPNDFICDESFRSVSYLLNFT